MLPDILAGFLVRDLAPTVSSLSRNTSQPDWSDLFRLLAPETAVDLMEPLPEGRSPFPLLQVSNWPTKTCPQGTIRLRVCPIRPKSICRFVWNASS